MNVLISRRFDCEFNLELERISKHSSELSHTTEREIIHACSLLETFPHIGMDVESEDGDESGLRALVVRDYAIIYEVKGDCVKISQLKDLRKGPSRQS